MLKSQKKKYTDLCSCKKTCVLKQKKSLDAFASNKLIRNISEFQILIHKTGRSTRKLNISYQSS